MRKPFIFLALAIFVLALVIYYLYYYDPSYWYTSDDHPTLQVVRQYFTRLNPKYGKIPLKEGGSAYTENKRVITLCLEDPSTGTVYDMNTIMYVALHELAHVISKKNGHGDEFKKNFAKLLRHGERVGIYDPAIPIPLTYCGVDS